MSVADAKRIIRNRPGSLSPTTTTAYKLQLIMSDIVTPQSTPVHALKLHTDMILKSRRSSVSNV
jgi:hypothetical protein